jgi:hypothetical protein
MEPEYEEADPETMKPETEEQPEEEIPEQYHPDAISFISQDDAEISNLKKLDSQFELSPSKDDENLSFYKMIPKDP